MTDELYRACRQAVHVLLPDGTRMRAGRACLFILGELGWRRLAHAASWPPLSWLVELGYRCVANHRSFWNRILFRRVPGERAGP